MNGGIELTIGMLRIVRNDRERQADGDGDDQLTPVGVTPIKA